MPLIPPKPLVEIEKRKTQQQPVPMAKGGTIDVGVPEIPEIGAFAGSGQIGERATPAYQRDSAKQRLLETGIDPRLMDTAPLVEPPPQGDPRWKTDEYVRPVNDFSDGQYNPWYSEAYVSNAPLGAPGLNNTALHEMLHHIESSLTPDEREELNRLNLMYPREVGHGTYRPGMPPDTSMLSNLGGLTAYFDAADRQRAGAPLPDEIVDFINRVVARISQPPVIGMAEGGTVYAGMPRW